MMAHSLSGFRHHAQTPHIAGILAHWLRWESTIRFDASKDEVADIIERHLDTNKQAASQNEDPREHRLKLLTTRREALSLYREIMRITALFDWRNEQGMVWRDVLRESARKEFEVARYERDPELINRMLVVGRDAVHQVAERFVKKRQDIVSSSLPPSPRGGNTDDNY